MGHGRDLLQNLFKTTSGRGAAMKSLSFRKKIEVPPEKEREGDFPKQTNLFTNCVIYLGDCLSLNRTTLSD